MGHSQPIQHHREWRFADEGEAARFDATLAKAITSCLSNLERNGHSFLISREHGAGVIVRRLESESGELLACVERLMGMPEPERVRQEEASSGGRHLLDPPKGQETAPIFHHID